MTPMEIGVGALAGVLSCLTPETLLLIPLFLAAAGSAVRASLVAIMVGLGLSLIATGAVAASIGMVLAVDATWLRRIVCGLLLLQGIVLLRESTVDRLPFLTGGAGGVFDTGKGAAAAVTLRHLLLALIVGANWVPGPSPVLLKASLMAARGQNLVLALAILFAFGAGAAVPWILLGRIVRLLARPFASGLFTGMAGTRLLGLALLAVGIVGMSGFDADLVRWANTMLPGWPHKLAVMF